MLIHHLCYYSLDTLSSAHLAFARFSYDTEKYITGKVPVLRITDIAGNNLITAENKHFFNHANTIY